MAKKSTAERREKRVVRASLSPVDFLEQVGLAPLKLALEYFKLGVFLISFLIGRDGEGAQLLELLLGERVLQRVLRLQLLLLFFLSQGGPNARESAAALATSSAYAATRGVQSC